MKIDERYTGLELLQARKTVVCSDGEVSKQTELIIVEHLIDVYVDEILTMKLTCTPQYLSELVLGRLLTEGMIVRPEDVESIYICEHGKMAWVLLKNEMRSSPLKEYAETVPTCCTGNRILNDYFMTDQAPEPVKPIAWTPEEMLQLKEAFQNKTPLYDATHSAHSAFLMTDGKLVFRCEDIGRHNALDKAIGYAMRTGYDLHRSIVYTSGRVPTDMAMKAIRARIPILVCQKPPTREAVMLAEEYGLTLLELSKDGRLKIHVKQFI